MIPSSLPVSHKLRLKQTKPLQQSQNGYRMCLKGFFFLLVLPVLPEECHTRISVSWESHAIENTKSSLTARIIACTSDFLSFSICNLLFLSLILLKAVDLPPFLAYSLPFPSHHSAPGAPPRSKSELSVGSSNSSDLPDKTSH